jgi:hypothetical protein
MPKSKRLIRNLSIWGAVFAIIAGSVLHFVYKWSGSNFIIGLFTPINESPWEHMKLVFTPLVIFAFIDYCYLRKKTGNYCFALLKEIGVAIAFILAVFYTYTSLTGYSILAIDITSFVVSIILARWFGYKILIGNFKRWEFTGLNTVSAILLIVIAAFFIYATIFPPHVNLFRDSVTTTYGIYESN